MSGQGQAKGGQNPYGNPYGQGNMFGSPPDYGGGYFSMGNSTRMRGMGGPGGMGGFGDGLGGLGGGLTGNQPLGAPTGNPFARTPQNNGGFFQMPGGTPAPSGNPFLNAAGGGAFNMPGAPSGNAQPGAFPTNPGNVDPNSPEYAAYYNSLPLSTRLYLAAPGSAQANFKYNDYNASLANPNQAHF